MRESTKPSKNFEGYGYFWWLNGKGIFRASGLSGQGIYIDRSEKLVIALHSARPTAGDDAGWAWEGSLFEAITGAIKD